MTCSMPRYFDTHNHIHSPEFDADRTDVLAHMQELGVWGIAIGTDLATSKQVVQLASEQTHIYACIGQHPNEPGDADDVLGVSWNIGGDKIVAVGECGLDYYRQTVIKDIQKDNFVKQIEFAIGHNLPLMLHIRSSEGTTDAHDDVREILASYKREYGDVLQVHCHFFTMDTVIAKQYLKLGATFGIPGVVTYKNAEGLRGAVRSLPLERMVTETDAPYAAPVPYRGRRNEPNFVIDTTKAIAVVRGEDEEQVREALLANALRVFAIQP